MPGDTRKVAETMIRIGDADEPPRRQLLGSDAYTLVRDALHARLDAIEAQRDIAPSPTATASRPSSPASPGVAGTTARGRTASIPGGSAARASRT